MLLTGYGVNHTFDDKTAKELGFKKYSYTTYYEFQKICTNVIYCRNPKDFYYLIVQWRKSNGRWHYTLDKELV